MKRSSECKGINCKLKSECLRYNGEARVDVIGSPWFVNKNQEVECLEYLGKDNG